MAEADFSPDGVTLHLSPREWDFLALSLSYLLHGDRLPDHDFRNILGLSGEDAERLYDGLGEVEGRARATGNHWNPRPPKT